MDSCERGGWKAVAWHEVESRLSATSSGLACILGARTKAVTRSAIANFPPLSMFLVRYPFGEELVEDGQFRLPCQCGKCKQLVETLTRQSPIPLGLVLENRVEVLIRDKRSYTTEPLRILSPGQIYGAFEIADLMSGGCRARPQWTVVAGTRSAIPLWPRTNKYINRALGLPERSGGGKGPDEAERWRNEFWPRLRTQVREVGQGWSADVLYIHTDWKALLPGDELRAYVFEIAWSQSRELRERGAEVEFRDATVSTILRVARGESVGFSPNVGGLDAGPFLAFQKWLFEEVKKCAKHHLGRPSNAGKLVPLPLLVLPLQTCVDDPSGSQFLYFSASNDFVKVDLGSEKYAERWKEVAATTLRRAKTTFDETIGFDFFISDTAHQDDHAQPVSKYKSSFFKDDFAEQLAIAGEVGWVGSDRLPIWERVLVAKDQGFLIAFVRIALDQ